MTKKQYDEQDAIRQEEQNRLSNKIQQIADGRINPPMSTAEGARLHDEALEASEALTEQRVQEHKEYCSQADEEKTRE